MEIFLAKNHVQQRYPTSIMAACYQLKLSIHTSHHQVQLKRTLRIVVRASLAINHMMVAQVKCRCLMATHQMDLSRQLLALVLMISIVTLVVVPACSSLMTSN